MMVRSFIAIEVPPDVQQAIASQTATLRQTIGTERVRWVAPHHIHLTLQFLGDVSPTNLEKIAEALQAEVATHHPFSLTVRGLGAFPNSRRARVLWLGGDAPVNLLSLVRGIQAVNRRLGYPPEEREFSPHLTIGRVRPQVSTMDLSIIRSALENHPLEGYGQFLVEEVAIFKSDLKPTGPIYTLLYHLPLANHSS
ncbi:MAG: RNA 2',3'-cyclic phosphodiesterase [Anaerolineales bacterium]|nr:RNA 2',3'-cyclic phosphodiesterase [Anaerolineales bacterium]